MKTFGEPIRNVTPILEIPCPELNFLAWANKRADYVITSQHKNETVSFAFVPLQALPEALPTSAESVLAVSLQNDVSGDSVLLFDLFIYMEKNNKYLKYLKKGTILSQATYDQLLKFGVQKVYINKDDLEKFYAYCARNKLFAA